MADDGTIVAVVLAAGRGERAGGDAPKQYRMLGGRTVLGRAVDSLRAHDRIRRIIVAIGAGEDERVHGALGDAGSAVRLVTGGATRRQSVAAAICAIREDLPCPTHVLVHDSARPFVPPDVLDRLIAALDRGAAAAIPVLPVADTLVRSAGGVAGDVVARDNLHRVQTPQAFRFATLSAAHDAWPGGTEATDDAQMVRAVGQAVTLVEGDPRLDKITTPDDFARLATINGIPPISRVGMGYDVHRLEPGRPLWLCGVEVVHDHGLAGHSDADVAIHALVDALLGAIADGDIGHHFPPSDPQWRGAPSSRFLAFARDRIAQRGGTIAHVDLTIICEAPRIGPHRGAMRRRLAELLMVPVDRVSVKATTTEGLDATGRREGIAAQAVATVAIAG